MPTQNSRQPLVEKRSKAKKALTSCYGLFWYVRIAIDLKERAGDIPVSHDRQIIFIKIAVHFGVPHRYGGTSKERQQL